MGFVNLATINTTKNILRLGFTAIVVLMVILTTAGIMLHASSIKRIDAIVDTQNYKTDLISTMRTSARERTVSLQKMLNITDPFDKDEEWIRFNGHGATFANARSIILNYKVTEQERVLLDQHSKLVHIIGPLQRQIAEMILENKIDESRELILSKAIPLQDQTFNQLSELLALQKSTTRKAVAAAKRDYQHARYIMVLVAIGVTLLSILIARYSIAQTGRSERHLVQEKERAQVTLHSIGDAVITADSHGRIEQLNTAAENLLHYTSEAVNGKLLRDIFQLHSEKKPDLIIDPVPQVIESNRILFSRDDCIFTRRDKNEFAIEYTAAPIHDSLQKVSGVILIIRDVTEMRSLSRQLAFQAHHDALTGLANRHHFEARLEETYSEAARYQDENYWLCYLDLDQFKVINDTCGHFAGDELLKQISDVLRKELRHSELIARMGGDEFTILLKHCDHEKTSSIVERLRQQLQKMRFNWEDKSFAITVSIGVVQITADSGGPYDVMRAADTACYIAKDQGRNRVHFYIQSDNSTIEREGEMQWVHKVNAAIQADRFVLYFQKIVNLREEDTGIHGEILLRMMDDSGNIILPGAFIPSAERYNLMSTIDRWVIKNSFRHFSQCAELANDESCMFAINLSAQSLCDDDFLDFVIQQLDKHTINASMICFEITETSAIANLSRAMKFIEVLKQRGCYFSLDDFGSGLSSFAYLKTLPVDFLKIDGTFVRDIESDPMDYALVSSINQMGHIMGIRTIAEYVENVEIIKMLKSMGIDFGQGFGISKPIPLTEILQDHSSLSAHIS